MSSCWSCLIILEEGATICPLCGADQTRPAPFVYPNPQPLPNPVRVVQKWQLMAIVIVVFVLSLGVILWNNFGETPISPGSQAAGIAAKSLWKLREALSTYALATEGTYPKTLNSLGEGVSLAQQTAQAAGYRLEYIPKSARGETALRGFVILARPEESSFLNLRIDETGVVRATEENRSATAWDPQYWAAMKF